MFWRKSVRGVELIVDKSRVSLHISFPAARSEYQCMFNDTCDNYRKRIEGSIKSEPKTFFKYVNLKKNRIGPDKTPPSTLKNCAASFSFPLCLIFNQ
jgi:hypothetical protein